MSQRGVSTGKLETKNAHENAPAPIFFEGILQPSADETFCIIRDWPTGNCLIFFFFHFSPGKFEKKKTSRYHVNQQMSRGKEPPGVVVVMVEKALGYRIESAGRFLLFLPFFFFLFFLILI